MRRIFVERISGEEHTLRGDEHKHLFVLRARHGDMLELCCGDGLVYICEIAKIDKEQTTVKILERRTDNTEPSTICDLFMGVIKGEHMEIAVQKCVELGVNSINPIITENTVKTDANVIRLQKIALEAAKQCGRGKVATVHPPQKLSEIFNVFGEYDAIVFPYEKAKSPALFKYLTGISLFGCDNGRSGGGEIRRVAIIIGPEGGFSAGEVAALSALTTPVTLGTRILRADTACIATTAAVMLVFGDME